MTTALTIIPARGGSKRVPGKNLLLVGGRPLIEHSILQSRAATGVSETYVSTDDEQIADLARRAGATVIIRPAELSTDEATSEAALLHVLDERRRDGLEDPELVVFLQCTSPVRSPDDIDSAIDTLLRSEADSLFSATASHAFIWRARNGDVVPLNYEPNSRPRSQDVDHQWQENGSIYVVRTEFLRRSGSRLGGKIAVYPMDYWSSFELDSRADAALLDWIFSCMRPTKVAWPDPIDLLVFDFDGVITDNTARLSNDGTESVRINRSDGLGIAQLRDAGVPMIVLSTETNEVVAVRCAKLGIECKQGLSDKALVLQGLITERGLDPRRVIYVGNDVNDLGCFELVGFPVAVADAHRDVVSRAAVVLTARGGAGAVRELSDSVLRQLQGDTQAD